MIVDVKSSDNVIIIVNYNGSLDTISCINSIRNSTVNTSIIIVDNCSSFKDYEEVKSKCVDVTIIRSNINLGFAGGNNLGIREALKYKNIKKIILLNNDTEVTSNCFKLLLDNLTEGVITTPKMLYFYDKKRIWYAGGHINKITGRAIHNYMNKIDANLQQGIMNCDFTSGCCMAFTVSDIQRIGFLEETYFMYCEDTEFCLRAIKNGLSIKYIPESVIYHKVSQSTGGGDSDFCLYYMTRNRMKYLKEYRSYFSVFAIPFTLISRYIRMILYILKKDKRWKAINKGIIDFYSHVEGNSYNKG